MLRSDGQPAAHPTFSLVLFNHKTRDALQKQGRFVLKSSDIDLNITLNEIRNSTDDDGIRNVVKKLEKQLHMFSSNIPCTPAYWKSTRFEFKATTFFNSYVNKSEIRLFHTGSLAEFHEYHLRLLLYNYVSSLSFYDEDSEQNILNCDKCFSSAVQKYKNVVTHYMGSKFELWYAFVMNPIYGVKGSMASNEFAKSRGALHYHSIAATLRWIDNEVSEKLNGYAKGINMGMNNINEFIEANYDYNLHGDKFPICPSLDISTNGLEMRKFFVI